MKMLVPVIATLSVVICGCQTENPQSKQSQPFITEISPARFLVLEVTPHGEPSRGNQIVVLRLAPHYGKISKKSLEFRLKHETQELSLVTYLSHGYEIQKGDIIGYKAYQRLRSKIQPRKIPPRIKDH